MGEIITQERVVMVSHRVISTRRASPRTEKSPTMAPNDKSSDSSICRTCHAAWHRWPHSHVEPIHIDRTSTWKNVASCTHTRNCTECRNETNMWLRRRKWTSYMVGRSKGWSKVRKTRFETELHRKY